MACSNSCNNEINKCEHSGGSNFVFIVVLYRRCTSLWVLGA